MEEFKDYSRGDLIEHIKSIQLKRAIVYNRYFVNDDKFTELCNVLEGRDYKETMENLKSFVEKMPIKNRHRQSFKSLIQ